MTIAMMLFFGAVCWRPCVFFFRLFVSWAFFFSVLFGCTISFTMTMMIPRISFSVTRRRYTLLFAASAESGWNPGIGGYLMFGFLYRVCGFVPAVSIIL